MGSWVRWAGSADVDPVPSPGTPNQVIEYKELFTIQAQYRQDASEDKHKIHMDNYDVNVPMSPDL